ncbi:MAG TPA: hypothetical protein VFB21_11485 [Chthonomonadaceae bacterium]|nr:hypothetical protein [Chthonomonadaceae bacterium]
MYLPTKWQEMSYPDWNHRVKGLMAVWELAFLLGLEDRLEENLCRDTTGALAERCVQLGHTAALLTTALLLPQELSKQADGGLSLNENGAAYEEDFPLLLIHLGMTEAMPPPA